MAARCTDSKDTIPRSASSRASAPCSSPCARAASCAPGTCTPPSPCGAWPFRASSTPPWRSTPLPTSTRWARAGGSDPLPPAPTPAPTPCQILLGGAEGTLQLWNVRSGRMVFEFARWAGTAVTALAQSTAVDVVGVGFADGRIVVHNLRTDEVRGPIPSPRAPCAHRGAAAADRDVVPAGRRRGDLPLLPLRPARGFHQGRTRVHGPACLRLPDRPGPPVGAERAPHLPHPGRRPRRPHHPRRVPAPPAAPRHRRRRQRGQRVGVRRPRRDAASAPRPPGPQGAAHAHPLPRCAAPPALPGPWLHAVA